MPFYTHYDEIAMGARTEDPTVVKSDLELLDAANLNNSQNNQSATITTTQRGPQNPQVTGINFVNNDAEAAITLSIQQSQPTASSVNTSEPFIRRVWSWFCKEVQEAADDGSLIFIVYKALFLIFAITCLTVIGWEMYEKHKLKIEHVD